MSDRQLAELSAPPRWKKLFGRRTTARPAGAVSGDGLPESAHGLTDEQFRRIAGACPQCGGAFSREAPIRCPKCLSTNLEEGPPKAMVD